MRSPAALAGNPSLLIADEPTSALDTVVQRHIVNLLDELVRDSGLTLLFVTHDIALASERADKIAVLYKGKLVESGAAAKVLGKPQHPYTRALDRRAYLTEDTTEGAACRNQWGGFAMKEGFAEPPVLDVKNLGKRFGDRTATGLGEHQFSRSEPGKLLAVVGASGAGKTTLARLVMRLADPDEGSIHLRGRDITVLHDELLRPLRPRFQMVFQDPLAAFNPRASVKRILQDPLRINRLAGKGGI